MRKILMVTMVGVGLLVIPGAPPARALPHGCASMNRDFNVDADLFARSLDVRIHKDEPCSFAFSEGDTYSGSGRYSVACASGGYVFHPDYADDREVQQDVNVPIPTPCEVGDLVTIDGFHTGTGGAVVAGGAGSPGAHLAERADDVVTDVGDAGAADAFHELCDPGTEPGAAVSLVQPQDYNGLLTYAGTISCLGASVEITSVSITGTGGQPPPAYAGTARCNACKHAITVSATVPARAMEWEVEMHFDVTRPGRGEVVHGRRVGRYVTTWAGHVTTVTPSPDDNTLPCSPSCG